jgi:hypothetical protein
VRLTQQTAVDDLPMITPPATAAGLRRQQRRQHSPFPVAHISTSHDRSNHQHP